MQMKLFDSELKLMEMLWENESIRAKELSKYKIKSCKLLKICLILQIYIIFILWGGYNDEI